MHLLLFILTKLNHTNTDIQTGGWGNGLAKLNKCSQCDLNGRQSRSDVLKCAFYYSLSPFLSIYLSSLCLFWSLSLPGSPVNPTAAPPPFCFLPTTVSFTTFAFSSPPLPLMYFLSPVSVFCFFLIHVGNLCWDQPAGHLAVMIMALTAEWRWPPELPDSDLSLSLLLQLQPYLSIQHFPLFIFEHQL